MRVKRHKNHRRIMRFYRLHFGVHEPYHVIVDGTFITHALQQKIHIKEQLPKVLEGRATPMVTGCVMAELRKLGDRAMGAAIIAKGFYRLKCGHDDAPLGAAQCVAQQIGESNERRFLVATQDPILSKRLRSVPGVPLLRLHGQVPQLEEPSDVSRGTAGAQEARKMKAKDWEKPKLPELAAKEAKIKELAERPPKKRKGPKCANSLSCKKKKSSGPSRPPPVKVEPEAPKPKRVRSRRMGTRTREEAERLHEQLPIVADDNTQTAFAQTVEPARKRTR